jgi:hypothetical protein
MQPQPQPELDLGLPPRGPGTYAIGTKVTPDCDLEEVFTGLMREGWKPVGDGSFTNVFISPDRSRVLKFADGEGQRATVDAALANPHNPHLPKIYGVIDLYGDYDFAYEAECLTSFVEDSDEFEWEDESTWPDEYRKWSSRWNPNENERRIKFGRNGPMKDALRSLKAAMDDWGVDWDAHPGNVMVRPSTGELVLNDLLA